MNNMKKYFSILGVILLVVILICFIVWFFMPSSGKVNFASFVNSSWDVNLPVSDKQVYYINDKSNSPFGDGDQYGILQYSGVEKKSELNDFEWTDTLDNDKKEMVDNALNSLKVPSDKKIDYNTNLLYITMTKNKRDQLVMAYNKEEGLIYIFERLY